MIRPAEPRAAFLSFAPHRHRRGWVPVRRLSRRHAARVVEHLLALDAEDRARRFGVATSDDRIRLYVDGIDFGVDEVLGIFDRRLRLVAMAHLAFDRNGCRAEFGVSVLASQRGRGLASRLFDHAVVHARNRGVRELVVHYARDNAGMAAIVRRSGAALHHDGGDACARLALAADTLGSRIGERLQRRVAAWDYRRKLLALRPA